MKSNKVSFVIPALNEEALIGASIQSILNAGDAIDLAEIIVVDNGSKDKTRSIAESLGAKVLTHPKVTVATLRNIGARQATGDIIIFLDADVTLTEDWRENIIPVLSQIQANYKLVTGSHCLPPEGSNWLCKYWFAGIENSQTSHLGTGHLVISQQFFKEIGGFSDKLETGEDYDICMKAKNQGGQVIESDQLKVIHNDFPSNLTNFMSRESWHGMGDLTDIAIAIRSKVVIASVIFIGFHLALLALLTTETYYWIGPTLALLVAFLVLLSTIKFRHKGAKTVAINATVFYFYLIGRSMSFGRKAYRQLRR